MDEGIQTDLPPARKEKKVNRHVGKHDDSVSYRSMSRASLRAEAVSPAHLASHFPHNPYCEICIRAHLKQSRVHKRTPPDDDQMSATTDVGQKLSADHIIIVREANSNDSRAGAEGESYAFSVRDRYSGIALIFPQNRKTMEENYKALKFFQGASG